jgi:hypothetical protein
VTWQTVLDVIDAVESWIAGQSYWVQVVVLLAVLGPLCYLLAGLIDRVVEAVLAWHGRRDLEPARSGGAPVAVAGSAPASSALDALPGVTAQADSTAGQASVVKSDQ